MEEKNVVVDERIERLRGTAKALIINYIKDMYGDREGVDSNISRIEQELSAVNIIPENRISGSPTLASNDKKGNVTLRFKDKDNISDEEINDFLETIIHEFYHTVSKSDGKENAVFLEEGFVTYITAKTIRHSVEHLPEIEGVDPEQLREQLSKQDLINGYAHASEFVRSAQLVMDLYGYDATFEYMFSDNGTKTLSEVASKISPEFGETIMRQINKSPANSRNLATEKMFFKAFFDRVELERLDKSTIEMNELLQDYLIRSGIALHDARIKEILEEVRPELVAYQELLEETKKCGPEQRRERIEEVLPNGDFQWELHESVFDTVKQMTGGLKDFYDKSDSKLKCRTFGNTSFYALAICYDMVQRGIEQPTDKETMAYLRIYDIR